MVERGSQIFRPAAIPLVQPHHVKACDPRLFRRPEHIIRLARAFQAVEQHDRRMLARPLLPVAIAPHFCSRLHFEEAQLAFAEAREFSRPEDGCNRHQVRISEQRKRLKIFHATHTRWCVARKQPAAGKKSTAPIICHSAHIVPRSEWIYVLASCIHGQAEEGLDERRSSSGATHRAGVYSSHISSFAILAFTLRCA